MKTTEFVLALVVALVDATTWAGAAAKSAKEAPPRINGLKAWSG